MQMNINIYLYIYIDVYIYIYLYRYEVTVPFAGPQCQEKTLNGQSNKGYQHFYAIDIK